MKKGITSSRVGRNETSLSIYFGPHQLAFDGAEKSFNPGIESDESLQQIENSHSESIRACAGSMVYTRRSGGEAGFCATASRLDIPKEIVEIWFVGKAYIRDGHIEI
jgi:hypothetical protein